MQGCLMGEVGRHNVKSDKVIVGRRSEWMDGSINTGLSPKRPPRLNMFCTVKACTGALMACVAGDS